LTLLKNKKTRNLILICLGSFIVLIVFTISESSCGVKHMIIANDVMFYERTLDPEFCEELVNRIDLFDSQCSPQIEILDCG